MDKNNSTALYGTSQFYGTSSLVENDKHIVPKHDQSIGVAFQGSIFQFVDQSADPFWMTSRIRGLIQSWVEQINTDLRS